jgi:hypothetical protein
MQSPALAKRRAFTSPGRSAFLPRSPYREQVFTPGFIQDIGLQRQVLIARGNPHTANQNLSRYPIEFSGI